MWKWSCEGLTRVTPHHSTLFHTTSFFGVPHPAIFPHVFLPLQPSLYKSGSKCKFFWLFSRLTYAFDFCSIGLMDGLMSQDFHEPIKQKDSLGFSSTHSSSNPAVLPVYQDSVETLVTRTGKTKQNKTPSQDTLLGMFTANYSLGIYCPASFHDKFSTVYMLILYSLCLPFICFGDVEVILH